MKSLPRAGRRASLYAFHPLNTNDPIVFPRRAATVHFSVFLLQAGNRQENILHRARCLRSSKWNYTRGPSEKTNKDVPHVPTTRWNTLYIHVHTSCCRVSWRRRARSAIEFLITVSVGFRKGLPRPVTERVYRSIFQSRGPNPDRFSGFTRGRGSSGRMDMPRIE